MALRLRNTVTQWRRACFFSFLLGLSGCVTSSSMESEKRDVLIHLNALRCSENDGFSAVGHMFSLNSLQGVAFHSSDRGLTWRGARIEGTASGVSLSLIALPDKSGEKRLFITGYQAGSSVLSQIWNQYSLEPGAWWSSTDGGMTWLHSEARIPLPTGRGFGQRAPELFPMHGGNTLIALAQGSRKVMVLRSTDWGKSWKETALPKLELLQSVTASKNGDVVVAGTGNGGLFNQDSFVISSSDAGETWRANLAPSRLSLYLTTGGNTIAYNADQLKFGRTLIYRSPDIGTTWVRTAEFEGPGRIMSIVADGRNEIIAVTEYGFILFSNDDGITWRNQGQVIATDNRVSGQRKILFFENGIVLVIVGRGAILRSTDRGNTWNQVAVVAPETEGMVNLCSDGAGLIVAMGGWSVIRSKDWGVTWQRGRIEDQAVSPAK